MAEVSPYNRLVQTLETDAPSIAVPVTKALSDELVTEITESADIVELRVDQLLPCTNAAIFEQARRFGELPILVTIRSAPEGGAWVGTADNREQLFAELLPWVDGVDVELASPSLARVVERTLGKVVIASSHDFSGTPAYPQLEHRFYQAMQAGADYFKIATTVHTEDDLANITGFMELNKGEPIIAVAMGEYGVEGRLELARRGSRATFAFVGEEPLVPGQLSLAQAIVLRERP